MEDQDSFPSESHTLKYDVNEIESIVENAVSELARGYYRYCENGMHEEAYRMLGCIQSMILEIRGNLRDKYGFM